MKKYLNAALHKLTVLLEFIISFVLAAGIIILLVQLILSMPNVPDLNIYPNYEDLVETCFNLIIGVELIRMLYQHKPSTVFEVLLFAIARQVIMAHNNPVSSLIGVISIALLFATRKFLFIEFDESEKIIFRATTKARIVNSILHVHIPYEDEQTLYDVITKRIEQEKTEIGVGASTFFDNFGLRVAKMHNGKISRIEVIRSIH